jgi:hypothetical protein
MPSADALNGLGDIAAVASVQCVPPQTVFLQVFAQSVGVVGHRSLAAFLERLGDAHGKGKAGVRPAARHAELAVNLSGALAVCLLATHEVRKDLPV